MEFTFYNVIYSLQSDFLDILRNPVEKKNFSKPRPARGGVHAGKKNNICSINYLSFFHPGDK